MLVANVPATFPLAEIKILRAGSSVLRRSRWPKLVGSGLTTPNFMFAMPWSSGTADPTGARSLQQLGVDPARMPPANVSVDNSFAHVLGCVEKDVNSQLTRVLATDAGTSEKPLLTIYFRNTFTVNQRFYLENVDLLDEGEYYHDMKAGKLYAWPSGKDARAAMLGLGAVVPVTDQLIEIHGAQHVVVTNFTFLDTTFYADGFWDGPGLQPSDAAVRVNYGLGVTISSCNFLESIGGCGVAVGNATTNSTVVGCLFDHVGQSCGMLQAVVMCGTDGQWLTCSITALLRHQLSGSNRLVVCDRPRRPSGRF